MINEKKETYKEIMDNQHELRVNLTSILEDKKYSLRELSKAMGLNMVTLGKFLSRSEDLTKISPLMKIREYIREEYK